jgi:hypothetical protein
LNLLALNAYRLGDEGEARRLARKATDLEGRREVQDLVEMLNVDELSENASSNLDSRRWHFILSRACAVTDSLSDDEAHALTRLAARVRDMKDGMADLILQQGDQITFSEVKLSHISRASRGAAVFLYLIDLGGADELIKIRPGVEVETANPASQSRDAGQGPFERVVTNLEGREADLLDALLSKASQPRKVDLTGLRVVR